MKCGDGYLQGNETCDDGGLGGCTSNCNGPNYGFDCVGGNVQSPTICNTICGDGQIIGEETCDDGNLGECNSTCTGLSQEAFNLQNISNSMIIST